MKASPSLYCTELHLNTLSLFCPPLQLSLEILTRAATLQPLSPSSALCRTKTRSLSWTCWRRTRRAGDRHPLRLSSPSSTRPRTWRCMGWTCTLSWARMAPSTGAASYNNAYFLSLLLKKRLLPGVLSTFNVMSTIIEVKPLKLPLSSALASPLLESWCLRGKQK